MTPRQILFLGWAAYALSLIFMTIGLNAADGTSYFIAQLCCTGSAVALWFIALAAQTHIHRIQRREMLRETDEWYERAMRDIDRMNQNPIKDP